MAAWEAGLRKGQERRRREEQEEEERRAPEKASSSYAWLTTHAGLTESDDLAGLTAKLDALGVVDFEDLKHCDNSEIESLNLKPVKLRKLKAMLELDAAPASPSSGPPWSYFLSHMQKEGGLMAHRLFTRLQEKGKASWLDVQMKARDEEAMMEGVDKSDVFIAIITDTYFERPFCLKEMRRAKEQGKGVISVCDVSDKNRLGEFFAKAPADLNIGSINVVDLNLGDIRVFNLNVDILMDQPPKQIP